METYSLRLNPEAVQDRPALIEPESHEDLFIEGGDHPAAIAGFVHRMNQRKGK